LAHVSLHTRKEVTELSQAWTGESRWWTFESGGSYFGHFFNEEVSQRLGR